MQIDYDPIIHVLGRCRYIFVWDFHGFSQQHGVPGYPGYVGYLGTRDTRGIRGTRGTGTWVPGVPGVLGVPSPPLAVHKELAEVLGTTRKT